MDGTSVKVDAAVAAGIGDASRLAVSRFSLTDFNGFSDTVGGLQGLGTVRMGPTVTVSRSSQFGSKATSPEVARGEVTGGRPSPADSVWEDRTDQPPAAARVD